MYYSHLQVKNKFSCVQGHFAVKFQMLAKFGHFVH